MTRLKAEDRTLRDKIVHLRGVEELEHAGCMELPDKYAQNASQVAQLTAENEHLRSERDNVRARQEVERLWSLVNAHTAESSQSWS